MLNELISLFKEEGFDTNQLLIDVANQIQDYEIEYQFPAVQRAWAAGKVLAKTKAKSDFTRESAYEIFNYLKAFRCGNKAWSSTKHHEKSKGVWSHSLAAWKVIDDAASMNVFTSFEQVESDGQDPILSEFVEEHSEYLSYVYYAGDKWGLPGGSPIFDRDFLSLSELVESLRELCVKHNFHDVVEQIDQEF
jgi:hypothetical protein